MKNRKRIIAMCTACVLFFNLFSSSVMAAEENTEKEEVIYANLYPDGTVKDLTVVNIFEMKEAGEIVDFGTYDSVKNMNGTEEIQVSGDQIRISAEEGRLYYEGVKNSAKLPWDISIAYYMDGKNYSAEEIAGKSGALKIEMKMKENKDGASSFYENFALQTTITLDGGKCTDIVADGATIANVGSDKQITYTILPGKGADLVITANVVSFEMESIAINGIQLNLDVDIDTSELQSKIDEVIEAVQTLDAGAEELNEGAGSLTDAADVLNQSVGQLHSGVGQLADGAKELENGLSEIVKNNDALLEGGKTAFEGICKAVEASLNTELEANGLETVTLTTDNYESVLKKLLKQLDADKVYEQAYNTALQMVTQEVEANAETLYAGYIDSIAEDVYAQYMMSQADSLYAQVAAQAVLEQLIAGGYPEEQAVVYLQTEEGQTIVAEAATAMTEEQKQQTLQTAAANLNEEQKAQIKTGAIASLTEDQKAEIKDGYIEEMMKSEEVTSKITAAVAESNEAAKTITDVKGQLDNYSLFYNGLKKYVSAVGEASTGANTLAENMDTLYENTGVLDVSVGKLHEAVEQLFAGTTALENGTAEFAEEMSEMDTVVEEEIDAMLDSISGNEEELQSFVSEKNTNVKSVQFVIKTAPIEMEEVPEAVVEEVAELSFWQKLLKLFGL